MPTRAGAGLAKASADRVLAGSRARAQWKSMRITAAGRRVREGKTMSRHVNEARRQRRRENAGKRLQAVLAM
jgi:hypothetical protein